MARAVVQSGRPTPQDGPSRIGCGTPCSDRASNILLSAQWVQTGPDFLTLVVENRGEGIIHRRFLIVPAPLAKARRLKEELKEFLFAVELGGSGCDGVFGGIVAELSACVGECDDAIAKAFHAFTLRRSSALIRRNPKTRVVVIAMEGCCARHTDDLLSASCAAWGR